MSGLLALGDEARRKPDTERLPSAWRVPFALSFDDVAGDPQLCAAPHQQPSLIEAMEAFCIGDQQAFLERIDMAEVAAQC